MRRFFVFSMIYFFSILSFLSGYNVDNIPIGMQNIAMNQSITALARRTEAIYVNPGNVGLTTKREISYFHTGYLSNISCENISFVSPLFLSKFKNSNASIIESIRLGASINYLYYTDINIYDSFGNIVNSINYSLLRLKTVLALPLIRFSGIRIYMGGTLSYIKESLDTDNSSNVSYDFGALMILHINKKSFLYSLFGPQFRLGYSYKQDYSSFGIGFKALRKIFVGIDFKKVDGISSTNIGGEIWLWKRIGIRGGYATQNSFSSYSYGISFALKKSKIKRIYIEFSKVIESDIDNTYNIGVKYAFK